MSKIECRCPMCKKLHDVNTVTLSPARPWIYCSDCNPKVAARSGGINQVIPNSNPRNSPRIGAE